MDVMVSIPRTSCIEPSHEKTCFCHMQLCCSLCRQYNTSTCYIQNFKPLACFIVKCMNFNAKQELLVVWVYSWHSHFVAPKMEQIFAKVL